MISLRPRTLHGDRPNFIAELCWFAYLIAAAGAPLSFGFGPQRYTFHPFL